jgi:two-component system chemotaxis response regulator CheY
VKQFFRRQFDDEIGERYALLLEIGMELTLKALVVDDSKVMRMMVIRSLQRVRGVRWEFVEACDGFEATRILKERMIDICFIDWNMPNMSGMELVRQIRSEEPTPMPLVMVTSEKTAARIEEAMTNGGVNVYICKPFTDDEVGQKIGGILAEIRNQRGSETVAVGV